MRYNNILGHGRFMRTSILHAVDLETFRCLVGTYMLKIISAMRKHACNPALQRQSQED